MWIQRSKSAQLSSYSRNNDPWKKATFNQRQQTKRVAILNAWLLNVMEKYSTIFSVCPWMINMMRITMNTIMSTGILRWVLTRSGAQDLSVLNWRIDPLNRILLTKFTSLDKVTNLLTVILEFELSPVSITTYHSTLNNLSRVRISR